MNNRLPSNHELEDLVRILVSGNEVLAVSKRLSELKSQLTVRARAFELPNLIYGGLIAEAASLSKMDDKEGLEILLSELIGERPYYKSYVFFDDLRDLLNETSFTHYQLLKELTIAYRQRIDSLVVASTNDEIIRDQQLDQLHELTYEISAPSNLPEFAIRVASHTLCLLPEPPARSFNLQDSASSFSTILPANRKIETVSTIEYIDNLLKKIQGEEPIYVDICISSSGNLITIR